MSGMIVRTLATVPRGAPGGDLLARAARLGPVGAFSCDLSSQALIWTDGIYDLFGIDTQTRIDRREILSRYDEESRDALERMRADAIARRGRFTLDARIVREDGDIRWMRITAEVASHGTRPVELYGLKQDVTQERARWEAMRDLAEHDALTGLANRGAFQRGFLDRPAGLAAAVPLGALVLLDIDGFKQVNDRHGHAAGDACLAAVATRTAGAFADAAMIARIGGDEFAVLAADQPMATIERRVQRLLVHLAAPIAWQGQLLRISASAGMAAPAMAHGIDAEALFAAADAALYRAKRGGRNRMRRATDR